MTVASSGWVVPGRPGVGLLEEALLDAPPPGAAGDPETNDQGDAALRQLCVMLMRRSGLYEVTVPSRIHITGDASDASTSQLPELFSTGQRAAPLLCRFSHSFPALCDAYVAVLEGCAQRVLVASQVELRTAHAFTEGPARMAVGVLLESEALVRARPIGRHRFNLTELTTCWPDGSAGDRVRLLRVLQRHLDKPVYARAGGDLSPAIGLLGGRGVRRPPDVSAQWPTQSLGGAALAQLVSAVERHLSGDPAFHRGAVLTHDGSGPQDPAGVLVAEPASG